MPTPSTSWSESISPDENARHARQAEQLGAIQKKRAVDGKLSRALHAKSHVGVHGTFTVLPGLDGNLAQGWLAQPGSYKAYVRFSNGSGVAQKDKTPDVRGIAIKVLGVPGKKLIPGMEGATTQDFLAILDASTPFKDSAEFMTLVRALAGPKWALLPSLMAGLGPGRALKALGRIQRNLGRPMTSMATSRFFSALPIKWGPYAVKYGLIPQSPSSPITSTTTGALREELVTRLKHSAVVYDFAVQFFLDEKQTPIEDASVEWSQSVSPFIPLARLEIPAQDVESDDGKKLADQIDRMSFDPWHATGDFRPLGEMMRARKEAYKVSGIARGTLPEP